MRNSWLTVLLALPSAVASASTDTGGSRPCSDQIEHVAVGRLSLTRKKLRATGNCLVVLSGFRDDSDNTRSLYWNGNGDFTAIVGWEEESVAGGYLYVRGFSLFPRFVTQPDFLVSADRSTLQVTHANGEVFTLDGKTGRLLTYTGGHLTLADDREMKPSDRGGIEIDPHSELILDYGWRRAGHPKELMSRRSLFRAASGKTCTVTNREFLKPILTSEGKVDEYEFRFDNDEALDSFLREKCPDWSTFPQ